MLAKKRRCTDADHGRHACRKANQLYNKDKTVSTPVRRFSLSKFFRWILSYNWMDTEHTFPSTLQPSRGLLRDQCELHWSWTRPGEGCNVGGNLCSMHGVSKRSGGANQIVGQQPLRWSTETVRGPQPAVGVSLLKMPANQLYYTHIHLRLIKNLIKSWTEHDKEFKLTCTCTSIKSFWQVAEGSRSSWLQTLGNQPINCSPFIRYTNRNCWLYNTTWIH